jgi:hypothetical protein
LYSQFVWFEDVDTQPASRKHAADDARTVQAKRFI